MRESGNSLTLPTVLVIDDDCEIVSSFQMHLSPYEVKVVTASSGTDGIWQTINRRPALIVTDLHMPDGDGDYVVECLKGRTDTCDIPVIVITGRRDTEIERWMFTLGVERYLLKPVDRQSFLQAVAEFVDLGETASVDR